MLTSLFSLFYVTGECHSSYTKDEPSIFGWGLKKAEGLIELRANERIPIKDKSDPCPLVDES